MVQADTSDDLRVEYILPNW